MSKPRIPHARKPYSTTLKTWLQSHLFPAEFSTKYNKDLTYDILTAWQKTFEADGIDNSDGSYTLATNHKPEIISAERVSSRKKRFELVSRFILSWAIIYSGLPSRPIGFVQFKNGLVFPILSLNQFFRNLIGGWDSDPKISLEKKIWQWLSFPVKIAVILPLKLLTYPIKFFINFVIKDTIELGPLMLASFSARLLGLYRRTGLGRAEFPGIKDWKKKPGLALLGTFVIAIFRLPYLILGSLHFAFKLVALVGRAASSPDKSFRDAFNAGRELKFTFGGSKAGIRFGRFLSNFIGAVFALISLAITTTVWIITFPVLLSYISAYFPVIVQLFTAFTQLPAVVTLTTWFANLPAISASMGVVNSLFTSLGLALSSAFAPATTAMAAYYGLQLTVGAMISGAALGLVAAISSVPLAKLGDFLSNTWNTWTHGGPITSLIALCTPKSSRSLKSSAKHALVQLDPTKSGLEKSVDDFAHDVEKATDKVSAAAECATEELMSSIIVVDQVDVKLCAHYTRATQTGTLKRSPDFADLYKKEHSEQYVSSVPSLSPSYDEV